MEQKATEIHVEIGFTANVGNYQSIKVNIGITDWQRPKDKNLDEAVARVYNYVEDQVTARLEETKRAIAKEMSK